MKKEEINNILQNIIDSDEFKQSFQESLFKLDFKPDFKSWDCIDKKWINDDFHGQAALYHSGIYALHPYSGMNDKDGKKIYHGDILLLDDKQIEITGAERKYVLVGFHQGSFMYGRGLHALIMNTYLWVAASMNAVKVVGNIYENIDLLGIENV